MRLTDHQGLHFFVKLTNIMGSLRQLNIAGFTHERVIHAPAAGTVVLAHDIRDMVVAGETIATIDGVPVQAKLSGVLRGMIAQGTQVPKGMKIADVDPRGDGDYCFTISDKARNISGGVLEAILHLEANG